MTPTYSTRLSRAKLLWLAILLLLFAASGALLLFGSACHEEIENFEQKAP